MAQSKRRKRPFGGDDRPGLGGHAQILTPVEARQGVISGRVIRVLAASLALAAATFVVLAALNA
jgi:hypothetical protein